MELYTEMLLGHGEAVVVHKEPLENRAQPLAATYPLAMISPKHVHSTHSQHTMLPWIREQLPEPALSLHPSDALARGIHTGDLVRVFNDRGQLTTHALVDEGTKPGMVSVPQGFWPEHFVEGHHARLGRIARNAVQEMIAVTVPLIPPRSGCAACRR